MSTDNLQNEEAIAKLKELAEEIDVAMMATDLGQAPFHTIPMSTKMVDKYGNIWFLSARDSDHNANIQKNSQVQLLYGQPKTMSFMTVFGDASISTDKDVIEELYSTVDDNWFDGVDDPNISAIKVQPQEAHYWDTKYGKVAALLKMAQGAITGNEPDLGVEGDLKL
jgi:general stress protein 26